MEGSPLYKKRLELEDFAKHAAKTLVQNRSRGWRQILIDRGKRTSVKKCWGRQEVVPVLHPYSAWWLCQHTDDKPHLRDIWLLRDGILAIDRISTKTSRYKGYGYPARVKVPRFEYPDLVPLTTVEILNADSIRTVALAIFALLDRKHCLTTELLRKFNYLMETFA